MINRILYRIEQISTTLQGKGWGSGTVKKEFSAALSLIEGGSVSLCIDIGGNEGSYTSEIICKFPSCRVVVFEPSSKNAEFLKLKFRSYDSITVEKSAVCNVDGETILYSNKSGSSLASLTKRRLDHININFNHTEIVKTVKFENYWKDRLGSQNIDICKIDIEGHELDALHGFGDAINHIDVIQFEFGGCNIDTRTYFQDFWYFLKDKNFEIYRITPFGPFLVSRYKESDEFFGTTNYLAKRKMK